MSESIDLSRSPLLSRPIIERDYDVIDTPANSSTPEVNNIHQQHSGVQQSQSTPQPQPQPQSPFSPSPTPPPAISDIPSFTPSDNAFNDDSELGGGSGDSGGGSSSGGSETSFQLPEVSAQQFSNILVEVYAIHGTKIFYNMCRIDMKNVEFHVQERNIRPNFVPLIEKANADAQDALKPTDEEKKLIKKAAKDWLQSMNVKFANPQNGFLLAFGTMIFRQFTTARQMARENKELLNNMITATQKSGYYDSYTPQK